jgi:peptidoglycan LD-endopeptidase LytH
VLAISTVALTLLTTASARSLVAAGSTHAPVPTTTIAGTTSSTTIPATSTTRPATTTSIATKAAVVTPLAAAATVTKPAKRLRQMGSLLFPMQVTPRCAILDNFSESRSGGRSHEGIDILATEGQEVYAVADGTLKRQYVVGGTNSSLSGNAWQLNTADGTYYFFAHLSRFAPGLTVGSTVHTGDVIGYVGDTGNPGPGNFHLHFEVHPNGGSAVNALTVLEIPAGCTVS